MNGFRGFTYNGSISVPFVSDRAVHRQKCEAVRLAEREELHNRWVSGALTREEFEREVEASWARFHNACRAFGKETP